MKTLGADDPKWVLNPNYESVYVKVSSVNLDFVNSVITVTYKTIAGGVQTTHSYPINSAGRPFTMDFTFSEPGKLVKQITFDVTKGKLKFEVTGPIVDLVVTSFNAPGIAYPGNSIKDYISASASNSGNTTAGSFSIGFYLSEDSIITTSDTLLIGSREYIASLDAEQTTIVPINDVTLPDSMQCGQYFIGMLVDELNEVSEINENNNYRSKKITICAPKKNLPFIFLLLPN